MVNRSQRDIDHKKDIKKALAAEKEFFLSSPYKTMVNRMGTKYLQQVLNHELRSHIQSKIPQIKSDLQRKQKEVIEELKRLGYSEEDDVNTKDVGKMIYKILSNFVDEVQTSIDGGGEDVNVREVQGGAIINRCFYHDFNDYFESALDSADACEREIGLAISNLHGVRNPLFIPEKAFDKIVQSLLDQYRVPLVSCVRRVRTILDDVLEESSAICAKYPKLKAEVVQLVSTEIDKREKETNRQLVQHIEAQKSFMNTRHPQLKLVTNPAEAGSLNSERKEEEENTRGRAGPGDTAVQASQFFLGGEAGEAGEYLCFQGKLSLQWPGGRGMREAICTLTKAELSLVIAPKSFLGSEIKETVSLKNIECNSSQLQRGGGRQYILQRIGRLHTSYVGHFIPTIRCQLK